jgi:hypothetical protein
MPKKKRPITYFDCPHCGGRVKSTASACPHCGSDDQTGWSNHEDASESYEDDFDYDEYIEREFPDNANPSAERKAYWTRVIIILLIVATLLSMLPFLAF